MSTAHHPQTDNQTEVMNRIVEEYLRVYCNYRQDDWDTHVYSAEFAYSSSVFSATGLTPFFMDSGWDPKTPMDLLNTCSDLEMKSVEDMRDSLREIFSDVTASYAATIESQSRRAALNFTSPTCEVGDQIMLSTAQS